MDNGCITFHVIANSSKKTKNKQTKKTKQCLTNNLLGTQGMSCEQLSSTAHAFPLPDLGHTMKSGERPEEVILC